ncbi:hypothetical protein PHLCEN_2v7730, partial [Hermanssonia centrifuga]
MNPYLTVTARYIDGSVEHPDSWKLHSKVIGYTIIHGDHSGANIAAVILKVLDRYGPGEKRQGQCFEHIVHLAGKAFIEALGALKDDDEDEDEEWLDPLDLDEEEEVDEPVDFDPVDLLGKVLALINQVCTLPQACVYFATLCVEEGLAPLELIKWVQTQWGSIYYLLDCVKVNKAAVNKFTLLADHSPKVPNLWKKNDSDYVICRPEWEVLDLIHEVLEEVHEAHQSFSSEPFPTVWRTIPTLECLQQQWEIMADTPKFAPVHTAIKAGLAKLQKWYLAIGQTDIYYICLALDPGIKTEYTFQNWETKYNDSGMAAFKEAFNSYKADILEKDAPSVVPSNAASTYTKGYGSSWMCNSLQGCLNLEKTQKRNSHQELLDYLNDPLVQDVSDLVAWWG